MFWYTMSTLDKVCPFGDEPATFATHQKTGQHIYSQHSLLLPTSINRASLLETESWEQKFATTLALVANTTQQQRMN